ncbi:MAG: histone deacetylase [Elusimicrobiota bacterium]|nr:histone deacetylase [Elusimicrobiota bacterium]
MSHKNRKIIYSAEYEVDIGSHPFPTSKYRLVKDFLINNGFITPADIEEPSMPDEELLKTVHTEKYVRKILDGTLSFADEIKLELPYSSELAGSAAIVCAGSVMTAESALENGAAVHLGGGFHHAYPDHGEGFCVFNDVAVAAAAVTSKGKKVLIADCDLHQGNGTAAALKDNKLAYTFSMHQENNYPLVKEKSDRDVPLEDSVVGSKYNSLLRKNLKDIKESFAPDLVIYVAGSDVYKKDKLGGLDLTMEDIAARDRIIKEEFYDSQIPVAVVLAGGYAQDLNDTVKIHAAAAVTFLDDKNL